jgi:hypothetical protein
MAEASVIVSCMQTRDHATTMNRIALSTLTNHWFPGKEKQKSARAKSNEEAAKGHYFSAWQILSAPMNDENRSGHWSHARRSLFQHLADTLSSNE